VSIERLSRQLEEATRRPRVFGDTWGLVVVKSGAPELVKGGLASLKPSVVYHVSTPKPHDEYLGIVAKKGKNWHYATTPNFNPRSSRDAKSALRGLVGAHIYGLMKTVQGNPENWGNTVDDALKNLGCPILQKLAHTFGFVREYGKL